MTEALLVRARGEFAPIEWETATLPEGATGDWVQFTWLFGLSVHPAQHGFRLYLNDRELLMFRNAPVKDWKEWTVDGAEGSYPLAAPTAHLTFKPNETRFLKLSW